MVLVLLALCRLIDYSIFHVFWSMGVNCEQFRACALITDCQSVTTSGWDNVSVKDSVRALVDKQVGE